jgi:HTH-type transcriptional regulator, sugar sensing transcriptional regulator
LNESALLDKLKELGFNTYEAKVYVALLKHHPATGYEISKESGVPQARAYDTLKSLQTANIVVSNGEPKRITYTPISPEDLLNRRERSFLDCISYLRETLPAVSPEVTSEPVSILQGSEPITRQALEMIRHAKQSIFMELWTEDSVALKDALCQAQERGVMVRIVGHEGLELPGIHIFHHGVAAHDVELKPGERWLALAVDDREGIVGRFTPKQVPEVLVSRNLCIVAVIRKLVVHDICMLQMESDMASELSSRYGENMRLFMRKIFTTNTTLNSN